MNLNNSECAKRVLDWAVRTAVEKSTEYMKSECNLRANLEAAKTWKEYNPDDGVGGFGCNPYERERDYLIKRTENDAKISTEAHEVLNFVKDKICNMIDNIKN